MVKATINNFESLALSGKTLGNLTYSTRKSVGKRSDTDTAVVNINGSLDTLNIEPQAGFDFGMKSKTPLKLVNGKLLATEARSNGRSADAFDSHDLELFGTEAILKRDYRGQLERDPDTGETTTTGYSLDFTQTKKGDDEIGHLIRIILSNYGKYVPQGLKLAFVGNETTNWTIYADTLVPLEEKAISNRNKPSANQADKPEK